MRTTLICLIICISLLSAEAQDVKNTSYKTSNGEKVLRIEMIVPLSQKQAWAYFTEDEKLKAWVAPLAHMELKTGGYMVTNYDKAKSLDDKSSIKIAITNYLEHELISMKVDLNDNFTQKVQDEDNNLQEVIQLIPIDSSHTKIISSMIGWGTGPDWEKTYSFFEKGNDWTYRGLMKLFKK
ncbi:MAG: SRPBCC domain-containing protein [Bacteroidota bacterium]